MDTANGKGNREEDLIGKFLNHKLLIRERECDRGNDSCKRLSRMISPMRKKNTNWRTLHRLYAGGPQQESLTIGIHKEGRRVPWAAIVCAHLQWSLTTWLLLGYNFPSYILFLKSWRYFIEEIIIKEEFLWRRNGYWNSMLHPRSENYGSG